MNKTVQWIEEQEEEEIVDGLDLCRPEECLDVDNYGITIIAGQTESGKTNLVKQLIRYNSQSYNKIFLICSTIDLQTEYDCLPKAAILPLSQESIEWVLEKQRKNPNQRVAIILDDVVGKMKFHNNELFDYIASSCRHFRIHVFLLVQDAKKISPTIRDNCKVLFVTRLKEHSLKVCFELSTSFSSFNEFKQFMNNYCKDYNVVRFDLTGSGEVRVFNPGVCNKFKICF